MFIHKVCVDKGFLFFFFVLSKDHMGGNKVFL